MTVAKKGILELMGVTSETYGCQHPQKRQNTHIQRLLYIDEAIQIERETKIASESFPNMFSAIPSDLHNYLHNALHNYLHFFSIPHSRSNVLSADDIDILSSGVWTSGRSGPMDIASNPSPIFSANKPHSRPAWILMISGS